MKWLFKFAKATIVNGPKASDFGQSIGAIAVCAGETQYRAKHLLVNSADKGSAYAKGKTSTLRCKVGCDTFLAAYLLLDPAQYSLAVILPLTLYTH